MGTKLVALIAVACVYTVITIVGDYTKYISVLFGTVAMMESDGHSAASTARRNL